MSEHPNTTFIWQHPDFPDMSAEERQRNPDKYAAAKSAAKRNTILNDTEMSAVLDAIEDKRLLSGSISAENIDNLVGAVLLLHRPGTAEKLAAQFTN